ncbi:MAG: hypothetical protein J6X98_10405, partial [Bacteroidales bacterium]|nr:hypothetical protein [Bacteroidales bacterium]
SHWLTSILSAGGGSARRFRVSRNDGAAPERCRGKRRAAEKKCLATELPHPPPFFFPFCSCGGPSFRRERSERAESPKKQDNMYNFAAEQ